MSRSFAGWRVTVGFIILLSSFLIWHDTTARTQAAPVAGLDLFGPCSAPTFSKAVLSDPDAPANGDNVLAAVPADFDGDGRPDLAVTTGVGEDPLANHLGSVEIWKGQAQGRFTLGSSIVSSIRTETLAAADLNRDGHADVLYTVPASRTLVVHLGDGSGSAGTGSSHSLGCLSSDIAVHDFDGDTAPDVILTCADVDPLAARGSVLVLRGDGAGGLGLPDAVPLDARPGALAVADLNLDTHPDAVVADADGNGVWVLLGDASGNLATSAHLAVGERPRDVQVVDVDADGVPDILTANELSHDVSVLLGLGGGSYGPQQAYPAAEMPVALTTAEVNGDGAVDLAVADEATHAVALLLGDARGGFGVPTALPVGQLIDWGPVSVAVADTSADDRPDLVAASGQGNTVAVFLNLCDVASADIGVVSIVANPDPVPFGELVTHTVEVGNAGPDIASGATLRVLPYAELVSVTASQGTCGPDLSGWSRCALGDLDPGATATAWVTQRATNPSNASLSVAITSDTLDPNPANGRFVDTGVLAVGGLAVSLSQLPTSIDPEAVDLGWSSGALQTGYVVGRWANGTITTLPPRLGATASRYWDRSPVPGTYNCYFVVPLDDAGTLGHSSTLCIFPNSGWSSVVPIDIHLSMGEPRPETVRVHWEGWNPAVRVIWAQPLVEGEPARWTVLRGEEQDLWDDTRGVTTCYVVFFAAPDLTMLGYSNVMCAVPGATIAPRDGVTRRSAPVMPDGLRSGAARLRAVVEQTRAWLASRR